MADAVWQWIAYWWPFGGLLAVLFGGAWLARKRQEIMLAGTEPCPTCSGSGRVEREEREHGDAR